MDFFIIHGFIKIRKKQKLSGKIEIIYLLKVRFIKIKLLTFIKISGKTNYLKMVCINYSY